MSLWGDFAVVRPVGEGDHAVYVASVVATETIAKKWQADIVSAFQADPGYAWGKHHLVGGKMGYRSLMQKRPDGTTHSIVLAKVFLPAAEEDEKKRQHDGIISMEGDLEAALSRWFRHYTPLPHLPEWSGALLAAGQNAQIVETLETIGRPGVRAAIVTRDIEKWSAILSRLVSEGEIEIPDSGGKNGAGLDGLDLDAYLTSWGPALAERVQLTHKPLWDPAAGLSHAPAIKELLQPLYPAQADIAEGLGRATEVRSGVILCGEMGTGKTRMGGGTAHRILKGKGCGYRLLVQAPKHLVKKWAREMQTIIPGVRTRIVWSGLEMLGICRELRGTKPDRPEVYIFSRDAAKLGWVYSPTAIWDGRRKISVTDDNGKKHLRSQPVWRCSTCGHILVNAEKIPWPEEFFHTHRADNDRCTNPDCRDLLWQAEGGHPRFRPGRLPGSTSGDRLPDPDQQLGVRRAMRRCSIAWALKRKGRGLFDALIADECHELKGGDTAQGVALGTIASVVDKVILLTGSLFGGMALDVFYLLWRIAPAQMLADGQAYGEPMRWVSLYGRTEVEITDDRADGERNSQSRSGVKQKVRMRPGISPLVYGRHLLDTAAFLTLEDVAPWLPKYTEIPDPVDMNEDLAEGYRQLERTLERLAREAAQHGDLSVFAKWIQTGLGWADMANGWPEIPGKGGVGVICVPPVVQPDQEDGLYPKERRLLEILEHERSRGRKCAIFQTFTGRHDMLPRLEEITRARGFHPMVLRSEQVKPEDREEWIAKKLKAGGDLLICHPKTVETGLDLYPFPTIIWLQTGTSLFPVRQASRRSYRIGQSEDVEVRFLAYSNTLQSAMLLLMAKKMKAAAAAEGSVTAEGLRVLAGDDDGSIALAQALLKGMDGLETAENMWRQQAILRSTATAAVAVSEPKMQSLFDAMPVIAVRPTVRRGRPASGIAALAINFAALETA